VLGALLPDIVSETANVLLCHASLISSISLAESLAHTVIVDTDIGIGRQLRHIARASEAGSMHIDTTEHPSSDSHFLNV
jgi:hypothetical protein